MTTKWNKYMNLITNSAIMTRWWLFTIKPWTTTNMNYNTATNKSKNIIFYQHCNTFSERTKVLLLLDIQKMFFQKSKLVQHRVIELYRTVFRNVNLYMPLYHDSYNIYVWKYIAPFYDRKCYFKTKPTEFIKSRCE